MRHLLYILVLLISASAHGDDNEPFFKVRTRLGVVKVVPSVSAGAWDRVTLNGKTVYRATGTRTFISIHRYFKIKNADVLLLSMGCTCSDGIPDPLLFLVLEHSGRIRPITDDRFFSSDYTLESGGVSELPHVYLGFEGGRKKFAYLKARKVEISFEKILPLPLSNETCQALYDVLNTQCVEYQKFGSCDNYTDTWLPRSMWWLLEALSHRPGFNRNAWNNACQSACNGNVAKHEYFVNKVCDANVP